MGRKWIWIVAVLIALLMVGGILPPLMPSMSARMAPEGWEGEALVGSTAIALSIEYNRSIIFSILALVVVSVAAILALATVALGILHRSEIQEGQRRLGDIWERLEGGEPWRNS